MLSAAPRDILLFSSSREDGGRSEDLSSGKPKTGVLHLRDPISLDIIEVDANVVFPSVSFHREIDGSLVDSRVLGQLSVLLQVTRFVRVVTMDNVHLPCHGSNERRPRYGAGAGAKEGATNS